MSVNFTSNVLRPSGQKGMIKNGERGESYQCQVFTDGVAKLVVGDFVKLKDVANASTPVVEKSLQQQKSRLELLVTMQTKTNLKMATW